MIPLALYPETATERTRWILERRGSRNACDPRRPYSDFLEQEPGPDGTSWLCHTLLLTNRECAFRCLMCDLWQDTLETPTEPGAVAQQVREALSARGASGARTLKLYNAGSFFDPGQVPPEDYQEIAALAKRFERVVVESHTAFLRGGHAARVLAFRDALAPTTLEVAIGLETVHEGALARLNKRMSVEDFRHAAAFLAESGIALRVFLLVRPPFLSEEEGVEWGCRSLDLAQACGAGFVALLPTRAGNGALEALAVQGHYAPPTLQSVETCLRYGLGLGGTLRVTADLWDIEPFIHSKEDHACVARIAALNARQLG
jgi:archaeosine synthase beta-subunit